MRELQDDPFEELLREATEAYHRPPPVPRHEMWQRLQHARAARRAAAARPPVRRRVLALVPLVWGTAMAAGLVMGVVLGRLPAARHLLPAAATELTGAEPAAAPEGTEPGGGAAAPGDAILDGTRDGATGAPAPERPRPVRRPRPARLATAKAAPLSPGATTEVRSGIPAVYRISVIEHLGQAEVFLTLFRLSVERGTDKALASATARQLLATNRLLLDSPAGADRPTRALLQELELVFARIAQLSPKAKADDFKRITNGLERSGVLARVRDEVPAGLRLAAGGGAI